MSADAAKSPSALAQERLSPARRVAILAVVVTGTTLYSTTILIVSAVLPQLQGALSATADEISWIMTFNILATAVATPMTGWLAGRFGRRTLLAGSVSVFTLATYFCGTADSLEALIFWRIIQGAAGAPMPPLAQSIILDTFPRRQHGMAIGLYGMGVVVGALSGPMIGGVMAELYNWRWAFYIIVPLGAVSALAMRASLPPDPPRRNVRLDWSGFLLLSAAIACTQLVMSRGQRLDWFDSSEIVIECFIAGLAFYLFIIHSLTTDKPFLNLRLLSNRNYAIGLILVTIYGMLNFTPQVILPGMLRELVGFPESLIGFVLGSRGIGALTGFFTAMFIGQRFPRKSIMAGFICQVIAGLWMMTFDLNVTFDALVYVGIIQGFSVGLIWVPLTVVTFSTLKPEHLDETSSVYHLLRNIGSSLFISLSVTEIVRSTAMNYEYMTELATPFSKPFALPWVSGAWNTDSVEALARLSEEIARQAAMISYLNAFGMYTLVSAAAIPLVLLVARPPK